ncbi:MAG: glycosyltransferase [Candidatus Latescibacterota bacterium]
MGISKSINIGLKQASWNFISFIDADDVLEKDMLFEHFKCYEKGMDLVYTSYKRFGENKKEFIVISPKRLTLNMMMYSNFIPNSSASYNRKTLGLHFHTDLVRVCEDYIYWIEIFKKKPKNIGIQKILLRYRVHSNSMSSNKINTMKAVWKIHNEYLHQNFFLTSFYMFFWVFFAFKKRLF